MTPISFPYYAADIKRSKPLGTVTLSQFYRSISNPKRSIIDIYSRISQAEIDGDMGLKAELKTKLYSFTPAVQITGRRRYADISCFTGLMPLDFDHLPSRNFATQFKYFLFENYPFLHAVWLSASMMGVRALASIPIAHDVDDYKSYFNALDRLELAQYVGFDKAPQNPVLPLFLSYDPALLTRDTPTVWEEKYTPIASPPIVQYKYDDNAPKVEKIISRLIHRIVDNGHPQLRSAAFSLGGYVGAGHISQSDAVTFITGLIQSNAYLSQKPAVYIRTAKEMIIKGMESPLYL
jgi:hypothetical protein